MPANPQREVERLSARLAAAETRVDELRAQLDERLAYWHQNGVSIAALSRATGASRETVYRSIKRYRAQLGS